jgi:hypothetical protein
MVIRNESTLRRWAAFRPGTRMPDSIAELELSDQLALQSNDPDLHALLSNTATAELELAVMDGSLPDVAIPQADREAQARRAEAERLIAEGAFPTAGRYEGETYIPGRQGSLTAQFTVQALAPDLYEAESLRVAAEQAQQKPSAAMNEEAVAFVNATMAANRAAAQGVY